jgi:hypothetical protein
MEAPSGFVRKQKTLDLTNAGLGFSLQGGVGSPAADGKGFSNKAHTNIPLLCHLAFSLSLPSFLLRIRSGR